MYPRPQRLKLSEIVVDPTIQSRSNGLSDDTVDEYAKAIRGGGTFPPLVVFHNEEGKRYWLSEGFHRYAAYKRAEQTEVECDVRLGDRGSALYNSCGSNRTHGLRRTNADKRHAIALLLAEYPTQSDRWIATAVGCDHKTVGSVRNLEGNESKDSNACTGEFPQCGCQNEDAVALDKTGSGNHEQSHEEDSSPERNSEPAQSALEFVHPAQLPPEPTTKRVKTQKRQPERRTTSEQLAWQFKKWLSEGQKLLQELESEKGLEPVRVAATNNQLTVWEGHEALRWIFLDGVENTLTELGVRP